MILEDQISCEQCGFPHVAVHFRPDEYQSATCPICGWTMTWDEEAEDFVILEGFGSWMIEYRGRPGEGGYFDRAEQAKDFVRRVQSMPQETIAYAGYTFLDTDGHWRTRILVGAPPPNIYLSSCPDENFGRVRSN